MLLSDTAMLVFVLRHSGCVGRLTSGRIEWVGPAELNVHTKPSGAINDYISGSNLRSWCGDRTASRCQRGTKSDPKTVPEYLRVANCNEPSKHFSGRREKAPDRY